MKSEHGFELEKLDEVILALENLHLVLFGANVRAEFKELHPIDATDYAPAVLAVDSRGGLSPEISLPVPYFGTSEISFEDFIPKWVSLHTDAENWPSLSALEGAGSWFQTQVIESVNATESLARAIVSDESPPPNEEARILDAISGLNNRTRRYAADALRMKRSSLAQRLYNLAMRLGPSSARWLLGEDLNHWAYSVAEIGNALSHGYSTSRKLEENFDAMHAVNLSTRVVQKLAIVREAGFTNGQDLLAVELLADASGKSLIRHPNSSLAKDARELHDIRDNWANWRS